MAFVPRLLRPLLVYPARGGLRFGAARSDIVSLPISVDTLPIRIGTLQFRVGALQIHCGTLSFVCTLCGLWNENSRFLIESGELSVHRPQLLSQG